jgi:hypothetical protein
VEVRNQMLAQMLLPPPTPDIEAKVKEIDLLVRRAEMEMLVHPRVRREEPGLQSLEIHGVPESMEVCDFIWEWLPVDPWVAARTFAAVATDCLRAPEVEAIKLGGAQ